MLPIITASSVYFKIVIIHKLRENTGKTLEKYPVYTKTKYLEALFIIVLQTVTIVSLHHSCHDCALAFLKKFYVTNVTRWFSSLNVKTYIHTHI